MIQECHERGMPPLSPDLVETFQTPQSHYRFLSAALDGLSTAFTSDKQGEVIRREGRVSTFEGGRYSATDYTFFTNGAITRLLLKEIPNSGSAKDELELFVERRGDSSICIVVGGHQMDEEKKIGMVLSPEGKIELTVYNHMVDNVVASNPPTNQQEVEELAMKHLRVITPDVLKKAEAIILQNGVLLT